MSREFICRPSSSQPSREELARDTEGRYWKVIHKEQLICVCDSRVRYTPDFSGDPILGPQDITIDWTTIEGVIRDVTAMIGAGGGLADFEGEDLVIWRGDRLAAVIHRSLTVTSRTFHPWRPVTYDSPPIRAVILGRDEEDFDQPENYPMIVEEDDGEGEDEA